MNLQSPKKIFQKKTILDLKFKIPAYDSIMLWPEILKFQVQDSFLEYFFWRFGGLKNESIFLKRKHYYKGKSFYI